MQIGKLRIYLSYNPKYIWSNLDQKSKIVKRNFSVKAFISW